MISVNALLNYLEALELDVSEVNESRTLQYESNLIHYKAENERNIAHYSAQQIHAVEMFRSIINYGSAALKSAI
ncbi:MAG: hypothetical protein GKR94_26610 [Gammaproteobacteria bacterium]|nr:hypothetical protein [Gammaproteobacteria bacterium]